MSNKTHKNISKLMSLALRHKPEHLNLKLDENGWVGVEDLIVGMTNKGKEVDRNLLEKIVEENDKQRFAFNEDKSKIRANQGHSIKVDVELKETTPPEFLYHGTVEKFLDPIKKGGLQKMSRQHVHLSENLETATKVGERRGIPIILTVNSGLMHKNGSVFYLSENGVWLTDSVNFEYIKFT